MNAEEAAAYIRYLGDCFMAEYCTSTREEEETRRAVEDAIGALLEARR